MIRQSENINENYAARICRVDAIEPIPDAHNIVYATLGVDKVVVGKDTKVGDIVVFFPIGAAISSKYLSANNLYERSEAIRNSNYDEYCKVQADINLLMVKNPKTEEDIVKLQELQAQAKRLVGFFNKNGVVRMLKLRGVSSMGYVAPISTLEEVWPELKNVLWNLELVKPFDMIGEDRLCWKWLPNKKPRLLEERVQSSTKGYWWKKSMKKLKRFDRLVPGQFEFHYDTKMLKDNMHVLFPETPVTITVKMHGTSVIISNILTNKKLSTWEKIKKKLGFKVEEQVYDNVYSSRKVIKNQYINPGKPNQFYATDPHGCVNRDFAEYLSPGRTVYGEIVGYEEGTSRCIQHPKGIDHDYGCAPGQWAFMPYRITTTNSEGKVREWSLHEILIWNEAVRSKMHPSDRKKLMDIPILYQGTMDGLYPGLYNKIFTEHDPVEFNKAVAEYKQSENFNGFMPQYLESYSNWIYHLWRIEVLERMKNDKDQLGMELPEPLCNNKKAPREGIVLRIVDDPEQRAWKLKTNAHYELSQKAADAGEVDMEDEN